MYVFEKAGVLALLKKTASALTTERDSRGSPKTTALRRLTRKVLIYRLFAIRAVATIGAEGGGARAPPPIGLAPPTNDLGYSTV